MPSPGQTSKFKPIKHAFSHSYNQKITDRTPPNLAVFNGPPYNEGKGRKGEGEGDGIGEEVDEGIWPTQTFWRDVLCDWGKRSNEYRFANKSTTLCGLMRISFV